MLELKKESLASRIDGILENLLRDGILSQHNVDEVQRSDPTDAQPSSVSKIIGIDVDTLSDAEKRSYCKKRNIFVWQIDPEHIVARYPHIALLLHKAIKPRTTANEAVEWAKRKKGLHGSWRQIPYEVILEAWSKLWEEDTEVKDFVKFLTEPTAPEDDTNVNNEDLLNNTLESANDAISSQPLPENNTNKTNSFNSEENSTTLVTQVVDPQEVIDQHVIAEDLQTNPDFNDHKLPTDA